jgi:hypothetical protein
MWEFSVPPHKGDEHFDLGIWHPSALPADKQNKEGYEILKQRSEEDEDFEVEESLPTESSRAVRSFHDDVTKLVDALRDEERTDRSWSIMSRSDPLFHLISLWPSVAVALAPAILESASRHGLVCYDPQSDVVTLPEV